MLETFSDMKNSFKNISICCSWWGCWIAVCCLYTSLITGVSPSFAQVPAPERKRLFIDDDSELKKQRAAESEMLFETERVASEAMDFQAPQLEFNRETNEVIGSGGVLLSGEGVQAQASKARANLDTQDAVLKGNILVTDGQSIIAAESGVFNLDTELGEFEKVRFMYEDGGYEGLAHRLKKLSEFRYELSECSFTTCNCADQSQPWNIKAREADITREGYAHTYHTTLNMWGVPVFYSPWFVFPAKMERQTGLLAPRIGVSSRDGFQYQQPLYLVLDDYSDATFTPFIETNTRVGSALDYRRVFSRQHQLAGRGYYSDESKRGDSLRGTVVNDIFDPTFDTHRYGGFYRHNWRSPVGSVPTSFIANLRGTSDSLFIREIEDPDIADRSARYLTSNLVLRSAPADFLSLEAAAEYNQTIQSDQDLAFQRLPQFTANQLNSFRVFGSNPYGLKVVTQTDLTATNFSREEGFEGWRMLALPSLRVPFHFKNYFESSAAVKLSYSDYSLSETALPNSTEELPANTNSAIPVFDYVVKTGVERVYDINRDGLLDTVTGLGTESRAARLARVKHVIEPSIRYRQIPKSTDTDIPLFDSNDRLRERSLVVFGLRNSLLGRFVPRHGAIDDIAELSPYVEELPVPDLVQPLADIGSPADLPPFTGPVDIRRGEIREILALDIRRSYDAKVLSDDPYQKQWSDLMANLDFIPTRYFLSRIESNTDLDDGSISSWGISAQARDDRGDSLIGRYIFLEDNINQFEGNVEVALVERLKLGFYGLYDEREGEFIENRVALRFMSACDCWFLDVGLSDRINPDRQMFTFRFTFSGLGDVSQDVAYGDEDN